MHTPSREASWRKNRHHLAHAKASQLPVMLGSSQQKYQDMLSRIRGLAKKSQDTVVGATQLRVNLSCGLTIAPAVLTVLLQRGEWAKATVANSCLFLQDSGFQKFRKHRPSILNPGSYRRIPCARPRRSVSLRKLFSAVRQQRMVWLEYCIHRENQKLLCHYRTWLSYTSTTLVGTQNKSDRLHTGVESSTDGEIVPFTCSDTSAASTVDQCSTATSLVGKAVKTYDILYTVDGPLTLCT
ncbi:hypothetical protein E4T42_09487 [Aureobasidium subglaciale]|nr:hypothetical protein E4T42_09487 [Aureobasidium subglaciale]